jgi:TM2 domain-containing membrane protein YozV
MGPASERKDLALAYALWALSIVGICGVQRMYLGQSGLGLVMLLTFGFCGVGQVLDLFLLPGALNQTNIRIGGFVPGEGVSELPSGTTAPIKQIRVVADSPPRDDELDQLLCQAEDSIKRTETSLTDGNHGN